MKTHHDLHESMDCFSAHSPDGVVGSTQVDEEVPGPVAHSQQVLHALQVHAEKTGSAPDRRHAPGRHTDVRVALSQR